MQNKAASLLPHLLLPEPAVPTLVFLQTSSCWVVVKVTSVSEPRASLWTSPQPQWSCPNQSLSACVLHAALLLPPWTLVLGPGPLACPHWLLGGLLSTNSNPQRQTSHLGGLMGTSDLTPVPGWAAPSRLGLRPKPRSPSCLLRLTCIPSVHKCCGRNRQNISRRCFLSPRLHTEVGPSSLPLHPGTRHTPTAAHKQVS